MKYIIMCGGNYPAWETPRFLTEICGETLVERTIRLLKETGVTDIAISSSDKRFEKYAPVLTHENKYKYENGEVSGYWCDCFYPTDYPVCYIFGDVFFSPQAIRTIVGTDTEDIEFFGSAPPFSKYYPKKWVEPFALKVVDTDHLKRAIEKTKKLDALGKFWRKPIMWELWTVIKDVPLQTKPNKYIYNYTPINDYTCDIDSPEEVEKLDNYYRSILE